MNSVKIFCVTALVLGLVACESKQEQAHDAAVEGQKKIVEEQAEGAKEIGQAQEKVAEEKAEAAKGISEAHKEAAEETHEALD